MTITLSLAVERPKHLVGKNNNFLLIMELVDLLDGVCVVDDVGIACGTVACMSLEFYRKDDPMDEPICDQDEAFDWAMAKLVRELSWPIQNVTVLAFEPDQPPLTAKEAQADRNLGDRPFGG